MYSYCTDIHLPEGEILVTDCQWPCTPKDIEITVQQNGRISQRLVFPANGISKLIRTLRKFEKYTKEVTDHEKG